MPDRLADGCVGLSRRWCGSQSRRGRVGGSTGYPWAARRRGCSRSCSSHLLTKAQNAVSMAAVFVLLMMFMTRGADMSCEGGQEHGPQRSYGGRASHVGRPDEKVVERSGRDESKRPTPESFTCDKVSAGGKKGRDRLTTYSYRSRSSLPSSYTSQQPHRGEEILPRAKFARQDLGPDFSRPAPVDQLGSSALQGSSRRFYAH